MDQRVFARRVVVNLSNEGSAGSLTVTPRRNGVSQQPMTFYIPANRDFDVDAAIGSSGKRFDAIISSSVRCGINGVAYEVEARPAGVVVGV